ncbi:MAG: dTMP kinase [Fibrobacteres bacterium]|nr:dTMP kinase [Fibrobacterota bacterium]
MKQKGLFVSFEGIDGCGKSTQIKLLRKRLVKEKRKVIQTREPGGTPLAENIRNLILHTHTETVSKETELLLYAAARAQHVSTLISPNLKKGVIVLSDRFADSMLAYQGGGRNIKTDEINKLNEFATGGLNPDITFLFDLPSKIAAIRMKKAGRKKDRMEKEGIRFQEKVRRAFLKIAASNPKRIFVVDAKLPVEVQSEIVYAAICRVSRITAE